METITSVNGTPIAYHRSGSGPPLVLVHGTTADHTRWESVRPAVATHVTIYAMDRRGVGESGDALEYDLAREVEDIVAVVHSIDEPVVLLGHSFGALCCLEVSLRTDNVHSLILYEPLFPVGDQELYATDLLDQMERLLADGENEQVLGLLFEEIAGLTPPEMEAIRSAPNWPGRVAAAHVVLRESIAENEYEWDAGRFTALMAPTLLLTGSESPQPLKDSTAALDEALPNSRIAVFDGQGHGAMNTVPERFVDAVLEFIRETS